MDDLFDSYLKRGLKNWAAQHQPPSDGRQRLLKMAALPLAYPDRSTQWLIDGTSLEKMASQKPYEKVIEVTHPWFWILHLELSPLRRLA